MGSANTSVTPYCALLDYLDGALDVSAPGWSWSLFASSLMVKVWLYVALTAVAVDPSCTPNTAEDSSGATIQHDALSHGLCLTGTPKFSINSHVSPLLLPLYSKAKVVGLKSNCSH